MEGEEDQDTLSDSDDMTDEFEALMVGIDPPPKANNSVFITEIDSINPTDAKNMATTLSNNGMSHILLKDPAIDQITGQDIFILDRYGPTYFHGIMIDTGAAGKSTAGYGQYQAYKKLFSNDKADIDKSKEGAITATFGIGSTTSIGSVTINTPIGQCEFHVVQANTPFLLGITDMDAKGIILDNLQNKLISSTRSVPVIRRFGHPFLMWGPMVSTYSHLTETELRMLHRRFGHPSALRLVRLLERAGHDDNNHRQLLERITKYCSKCQKHAGAPLRFKFTLRDDEHLDFNHSVYVDIMYINGSPLLHVIDEATRFQAARWLNYGISALHVWEALRMSWIDVYLGPPDLITHDAGTNFTAAEFQQYANSLATATKEVPVEAANTMGLVERYHKPLRRAYEVIEDEFKDNSSDSIPKALILQMAVKAVNDTAGHDGLVPTLLVFGAYPRMSELSPPAPTISKRATAIKKAMEE
ncbi:hypothetical protein Egran_06747, partial [Elaphomyces granulatus]